MGFRYLRHGATDALCPTSQRHHDSAHHDEEQHHDHSEGRRHDCHDGAPVRQSVIPKARPIVARRRASGHAEQTFGGYVTSERPATAHHDPEYLHNHTATHDHDAPADNHDTPADDHDTPADDHDTPADDHDTPADDHDTPADDHYHPGYDDHSDHHDDHAPDHHHDMNEVSEAR